MGGVVLDRGFLLFLLGAFLEELVRLGRLFELNWSLCVPPPFGRSAMRRVIVFIWMCRFFQNFLQEDDFLCLDVFWRSGFFWEQRFEGHVFARSVELVF